MVLQQSIHISTNAWTYRVATSLNKRLHHTCSYDLFLTQLILVAWKVNYSCGQSGQSFANSPKRFPGLWNDFELHFSHVNWIAQTSWLNYDRLCICVCVVRIIYGQHQWIDRSTSFMSHDNIKFCHCGSLLHVLLQHGEKERSWRGRNWVGDIWSNGLHLLYLFPIW